MTEKATMADEKYEALITLLQELNLKVQRVELEAQLTRATVNERFDQIRVQMDDDRAENRAFQKATSQAFVEVAKSIDVVHREVRAVSRQLDQHIMDGHPPTR